MDTEFGDDLLCGFSGPSDVESSQSSDEENTVEETSSLDFLSAMLEGTTEDKDVRKRERPKPTSKKNRTVSDDKTCKQRHEDEPECEGDKTEGMSDMKARMKEMEAELQRLRQQIGNKGEEKEAQLQRQTSTSQYSGIKRTQSAKISTGVKTRTAHRQSPPSVNLLSKSRTSDSSNRGQLGVNTNGVSSSPAPRDRDLSSGIISQRRADSKDGVLTEKYSGLRIKNPLVSSELMSQRMSGRKMIKIPRIPSRIRGDDIEGDWVTIGVIVDKLPPRDTKKGDKYAIWKLSDLSGQASLISVFLFGKAYQEHWKTPLGHVVALLNPSIMPSREGGSGKDHNTVALSLDHPKKLMLLGVSQDFTICKAQTKSGRKCTNFAKSSDGGYCDYHTQNAYSRTRSHRMEFQNGYGPNSGKLQEKLLKNSKTDMFFCQGQTFVASGKGSSRSTAANDYRGTSSGGSDRLFAPGAKESATKAMQELRQQREGKGGVVSMPSGRGVVTQEGSEMFKQMLQKQSAGARMLTRHLEKESVLKKKAEGIKPVEKSAKQLLKEHTVKTEHAHSNCQTPLSPPVLGRGFGPGAMVDLESPTGYKKPSLAKMKAISLVKHKGPIDSTTSSVSGRKRSKKTRVMKRVQENRDTETTDINNEDGACEANPSKRRKMDPKDMERILNAKSSHDWIVKETELEMEQEYFDRLEKKENMEEKLQSIRELRVAVVQCRECNYIAEYPGEFCKKEKHHLSKFKATKKCFQCKTCQERRFVYTGRPPVDSCRKCGGTNYAQSSLYRERKGPKLPTEQLKLRGDEETFLG